MRKTCIPVEAFSLSHFQKSTLITPNVFSLLTYSLQELNMISVLTTVQVVDAGLEEVAKSEATGRSISSFLIR